MKRNVGILNDSPGKLCTIKATDKISDNCKYPLALIQAAQNQKQTNAGGLANLLQLKIAAKVMLAVNINIQDRLINGQTGNISHNKFAQGDACKIYVKFSDEKADLKATRSSCLGRQSSWVLTEKCETKIPTKRISTSPSIKRTQFS